MSVLAARPVSELSQRELRRLVIRAIKSGNPPRRQADGTFLIETGGAKFLMNEYGLCQVLAEIEPMGEA